MNKAYLYNQLLNITEDYLGPSAQRFIDRQIESHLGKTSAQTITKKDLSQLHDWLVAVVALLTDDENILAEYSTRIKALETSSAKK